MGSRLLDTMLAVVLLERERELAALAERAEAAAAGSGSMVLVCGEPGAGKTTFIEAFLTSFADERGEGAGVVRVLWSACDPLSTPRPLGPVHDLASRLGPRSQEAMAASEHSYDIFAAAFEDLAAEPTVLVVDDLHWADQGTVELLRFVLRRIAEAPLLVIGALREDELGPSHPGRALLGDVARSPVGGTLHAAPLSVAAIETLTADRPAGAEAIDAAWLHRLTGGNPFFVLAMLDHRGDDLPLTVRDAVLARTTGLGAPAWDLLHLLTAAPEGIADRHLPALGITVAALREIDAAGLLRRDARGLDFRHDLHRRAISSVIPPGASPGLHLRLLEILEDAPGTDPAVLVHHSVGSGDVERIVRYADEAGDAAARSGAHTQAATFLRLVLEEGGSLLSPDQRADVLQRLAAEWYLIDELGNAIQAANEAVGLHDAAHDVVAASIGHNALSVYEWYNAERPAAEAHAECSIDALVDGSPAGDDATIALGHALAIRGFLAVHATDLDLAGAHLERARALADVSGDRSLAARAELVDGVRAVLAGDLAGRERILSVLGDAPTHLDEIHSSGYSNLTFLDIEQRRLDDAAALLDLSIPLMVEHDLPICRVWQLGSRGRLALMTGAWDDAVADADDVLSRNSAPLARLWPHLVRGLIALRRTGDAGPDLEEAWALASRYGEPIRQLPAAAALAERAWITGRTDERVDEWVTLLEGSPRTGLEWSRGELAVWLRRLGVAVDADGLAQPFALLVAGDIDAAVASFDRIPQPYEAAIAAFDAEPLPDRRDALDVLDRLGADAVADKLRRTLRAAGVTGVPARRRHATRANPLGLTARQMEVLEALSDGSTNAELAARLFVSEKTVDHHVSAILGKLGVANRREAARRARELGILEPDGRRAVS
jgi:DNA-binding CsgD family transcriptional regulator